MFEIPEYVTIARQMTESISGKRIAEGNLGNSPHKFVWYNVKPAEFAANIEGKAIGKAHTRGRWLFVPVGDDQILVFGECGGRILLHGSASMLPKKYHLSLRFIDGAALSATTQMWGAMELYERGKEAIANGSKTVKAILTQDQMIPGLGNAIAQDIMFKARLHPKQPLLALRKNHVENLHRAILETLKEAIRLGGRNDEYDLHGNPGRYVRLMDKNAVGRPCPQCGTRIEKTAYLGGACYFCPTCQRFL